MITSQIKPTIGMAVLYWPNPQDFSLLGHEHAGPFRAEVTHIWSDSHVNLAVFRPDMIDGLQESVVRSTVPFEQTLRQGTHSHTSYCTPAAANEAQPLTTLKQAAKADPKALPRVTDASIESLMRGVQYHPFPGTNAIACCVTLANGFTVIGTSFAAATTEYDRQMGMQFAREDAIRQIRGLENYVLRSFLAALQEPPPKLMHQDDPDHGDNLDTSTPVAA